MHQLHLGKLASLTQEGLEVWKMTFQTSIFWWFCPIPALNFQGYIRVSHNAYDIQSGLKKWAVHLCISLSPLLKKGSCAHLKRRHTRHPSNVEKKSTKESHSVYYCIMPICAASCSPSRACSLQMAAELSIEDFLYAVCSHKQCEHVPGQKSMLASNGNSWYWHRTPSGFILQKACC